ncbi:MAG: hypothetical protein JST48_04170 [Bacteroidetes bacterium]|nr:hypothetical protein [Bacteroidota bacterium]
MKNLFIVVVLFQTSMMRAQFRNETFPLYKFPQLIATSQKTFIHGLLIDPVQNYRLSSPQMLNKVLLDNGRLQNQFYWTSSVTAMSYNQGKFGTYYYWDMQGNLSGTRGFIDLSGKHKRGFKLLFPWRAIVR